MLIYLLLSRLFNAIIIPTSICLKYDSRAVVYDHRKSVDKMLGIVTIF